MTLETLYTLIVHSIILYGLISMLAVVITCAVLSDKDYYVIEKEVFDRYHLKQLTEFKALGAIVKSFDFAEGTGDKPLLGDHISIKIGLYDIDGKVVDRRWLIKGSSRVLLVVIEKSS